MFENIVVRRPYSQNKQIDPGLIAETLLFYQKVHLLLDEGGLTSLLKNIGPDNILYLIDNEFLRITFFRENLAVHTDSKTGIPVYDFIGFQLVETHDGKRFKNKEDYIIHVFEKSLGKSFKTRRMAKKFLNKTPFRKLTQGFDNPSGIPGLAREDLNDPDYLKTVVAVILDDLVPSISLPNDWHFKTMAIQGGVVVDTNLDFEVINSEYHKKIPPSHSTISPAFLLAIFLDARADISFSSQYLSELVTSSTSSRIMDVKFRSLLKKRTKSEKDIAIFQETFLDDAHAIRDAINSGKRDFSDFLKVLEKSMRFKEWLSDSHPDIGLMKEYHDAVTRGTWIEKLPMKSLRFVFWTGAGLAANALAGPAASLGLGAADSLILDKLLKGWKPNHFIDGPLREFTNFD